MGLSLLYVRLHFYHPLVVIHLSLHAEYPECYRQGRSKGAEYITVVVKTGRKNMKKMKCNGNVKVFDNPIQIQWFPSRAKIFIMLLWNPLWYWNTCPQVSKLAAVSILWRPVPSLFPSNPKHVICIVSVCTVTAVYHMITLFSGCNEVMKIFV